MVNTEILCNHCHKRFLIAESSLKIAIRASGGCGYLCVTAICYYCGKEVRVPQTLKTGELLRDRINNA